MDAAQGTPKITDQGRPSVVAIACFASLVAAVGWSFRSSFARLINYWEHDSNYSHGWLIVPIALVILWQQRDKLRTVKFQSKFLGFLPLIGLLAIRIVLFERNEQWLESAMIPFVVAATVFAIGGKSFLLWALPGLIYLIFMIPLPPSLNDLLASPLQTLATIGSVGVLQAIGQPVLAEGNVIYVGTQRLEVAEACRGLSMLLSFIALITAMVILVKRPIWQRIVLMASTIPIALFCNVIRIAVTAVLYRHFDRPVQTVHDWAGMAMMVLAIGIVMLELMIMDWIIIEETTVSSRSLIRASYGPDPGPR